MKTENVDPMNTEQEEELIQRIKKIDSKFRSKLRCVFAEVNLKIDLAREKYGEIHPNELNLSKWATPKIIEIEIKVFQS